MTIEPLTLTPPFTSSLARGFVVPIPSPLEVQNKFIPQEVQTGWAGMGLGRYTAPTNVTRAASTRVQRLGSAQASTTVRFIRVSPFLTLETQLGRGSQRADASLGAILS